MEGLDLERRAGEALLIRGPSGVGKTVLLQSIAGLWPFAIGRVELPAGDHAAMFVPQLPYLPLGDLRTVVTYPREVGGWTTARSSARWWLWRCRIW